MQTFEQSSATAGKNNAWGQAISRTVSHVHDFMALLPFARVEGAGLTYQRTGAEPTAHWIDFGGAVNEATPVVRNAHTDLATVADEVRIPGPARRYMFNPSNIQALMQQVIEAHVNSYLDKCFNGNRPTVTFTLAGVTLATGGAGPNLRLGTGSLRMTVVGPVKTLAFKAAGDYDYGAESADQAAAVATDALILTSADGTQSITVNVNGGGLGGATVVVDVAITTATFEFDGIRRLAPSTQVDTLTAYANGADYKFDFLRTARRLNKGPASTLCYAMNPLLWQRHRELQDAMHATPESVEVSYSVGRKFPAFEGVPVVLTDAIPVNLTKGTGTALSEVWCLSLGVPNGEPETAPFSSVGLCGLYGGDQRAEALGQTWMGFWMEAMAKPAGHDYYPYQVGADLGLVNYSPLGLSCVRYIKTA